MDSSVRILKRIYKLPKSFRISELGGKLIQNENNATAGILEISNL